MLKMLAIFIKITAGKPNNANGVVFHALFEQFHKFSASSSLGKECMAMDIPSQYKKY